MSPERGERAVASLDEQRQDPGRAQAGPSGEVAALLGAVLSPGSASPEAVLSVLRAYPHLQPRILELLHQTLGSSFVRQVLAADAGNADAESANAVADGGETSEADDAGEVDADGNGLHAVSGAPPRGGLTRRLPSPESGGDRALVEEAAAEGLATPGSALPFGDQIARSFGRFHPADIVAHTGPEAAASASAMGAEGYAAGQHVVLGASPSLHTVAHEAAHVVQQRAGISFKSDAPGDEYERHADEVADRVVRGESAEPLLAEMAGGREAPASTTNVVQRKLTHKAVTLPTTWNQLTKKFPGAVADCTAVLDHVRSQLDTVEEKRLLNVWNKLAREKDKTYDVENDRDELVAALVAGYRRSANASRKHTARVIGSRAIASKLIEENPDKQFQTKMISRGLQLRQAEMHVFDYEKPDEQALQTQKHLATVVGAKFRDGEEVQTSLAKDKSSVFISTNKNGVNDDIRGGLTSVEDLLDLASTVAVESQIENKSHKERMADNVLRHALKLVQRLEKYLDGAATVRVPDAVPSAVDGKHAEIRIVLSDWSRDSHHLPSGIKLPCMACYLKFDEDGNVLGARMGPLWLSGAALTTQMEDLLMRGVKLSEITSQDAEVVAQRLAEQYRHARDRVTMGLCRMRDGSVTTERQPDSDSDIDEEEEKQLVEKMRARYERRHRPEGSQLQDLQPLLVSTPSMSSQGVVYSQELRDDGYDSDVEDRHRTVKRGRPQWASRSRTPKRTKYDPSVVSHRRTSESESESDSDSDYESI